MIRDDHGEHYYGPAMKDELRDDASRDPKTLPPWSFRPENRGQSLGHRDGPGQQVLATLRARQLESARGHRGLRRVSSRNGGDDTTRDANGRGER